MPPYPLSSPAPDPTLAHRRGSAVLTITAPDGSPLVDADVTVRQTGHAFGVGNIGFELVPLANGEATGAEAEALAA